MSPFILIALCLGAGALLRLSKRLPSDAPAALNGLILTVALPSLILVQVRHVRLEPGLAFAALMPWAMFGLGIVFFSFVGKRLGWDRRTVGALVMTGALGNTSFLGFPMLEAFYGKQALGTGIVVDQLGSGLLLATWGVVVAGLFASKRVSRPQLLGQVLRFPPFVALLVALTLGRLPWPEPLVHALSRIGETLIPLALISVGLQLDWRTRGERLPRASLLAGLGFKLFLAPATFAAIYLGLLGLRGLPVEVTLLEAAMAPMITGGIVAADYGLNRAVASRMVAVGIPLSFLTVPVWFRIIRYLVGP